MSAPARQSSTQRTRRYTEKPFQYPLCPSVSSVVKVFFYASAITSISTSTSFGKRATSTVERAGGAVLKYFP